LVYRLSPLHPLANYPGPFLGKVTKLWTVYVVARGRAHIYYSQLHDRYGDIVRVGPNELSIRDASIIHDLMGPDGLPKGPYWDNRSNTPSLIAQRDPAIHTQNRHRWAKAFSSAALKDYETNIIKRIRQLSHRWEQMIEQTAQNFTVVDVSAWMTYFSLDVLGDMAFSGGFELMRDGGDLDGIWNIVEAGNEAQAIFAHIPWILPFVRRLPGYGRIISRMRGFAAARVQERERNNCSSMRKDILYHLCTEDDFNENRPTFSSLAADGLLAIIAGSDTTATVLSALVHYLLRNPAALQLLQHEIEVTFAAGEEPFDAIRLSRMPWLNACLNETMRLLPPVPSGSQRRVPRGAGTKCIGKYAIPEETQVFAHTYSIHRDPRNFSDPNRFLPERWIPEDKRKNYVGSSNIQTHEKAAFIAFTYGPRTCLGKHVALMEMRMLVAHVVQTFKLSPVRTPADYDESKLFLGCYSSLQAWESKLEDWFVFKKGPLEAAIGLRRRSLWTGV